MDDSRRRSKTLDPILIGAVQFLKKREKEREDRINKKRKRRKKKKKKREREFGPTPVSRCRLIAFYFLTGLLSVRTFRFRRGT